MSGQPRQSKALVFGIVAAILITLTVTAILMVKASAPEPNARTVSDALSGVTPQDQTEQQPQSPANGSARLIELAEALGVPADSLPAYVTPGQVTEANRQALRRSLEKSVGLGEMSPHEANAVLKAFDLGLVAIPYGGYLADSAAALPPSGGQD